MFVFKYIFNPILLRFLIYIPLVLLLQSCCWLGDCNDGPKEEPLPSFNTAPVVHPMTVSHLEEVSGIVPSYNTPGHLWMMEDSDTQPKLDLVRTDGLYVKKVDFAGVNRDWEDIAIGVGPEQGKKYIYLGEIGDNLEVYKDYYIYRFEEPTTNQTVIDNYDVIHFRYSDGKSYNSETLLLDPDTKDLYVITKDQINVLVFKLPYPQSTNSLNTAQFVGTLPFWGLVAGDISANGKELLLKSYSSIFYWRRKDTESIYEAFTRPYDLVLPYVLEPQGESVCWDLVNGGYYTISEQGNNSKIPPLYFYSRK